MHVIVREMRFQVPLSGQRVSLRTVVDIQVTIIDPPAEMMNIETLQHHLSNLLGVPTTVEAPLSLPLLPSRKIVP